MKSSTGSLKNRGYMTSADSTHLDGKDTASLIKYLSASSAILRTEAAAKLAKSRDSMAIPALLEALKQEKALYTKLEICKALESFGVEAAAPLVVYLGKIGNNQHKSVPESGFKKKSYPLPRDIAARTIARIGPPALPYLAEVIAGEDIEAISEAVDAIGFICFYNETGFDHKLLLECFEMNKRNSLIKWKIIRALESFSGSEDFLNDLLKSEKQPELIEECRRSKEQIRAGARIQNRLNKHRI